MTMSSSPSPSQLHPWQLLKIYLLSEQMRHFYDSVVVQMWHLFICEMGLPSHLSA